MAYISKIACCLVSIIGITIAAPSEVEFNGLVPCTKNDPNLGECLKTTIQNNLPSLINGVPSIGLLPIDPFHVTSVGIDQGSGPVSVKLNFRDLDIANLRTVNINKINTDLNISNIMLDLNFEKPITLDGEYDVKGKVLILPISGNGKCQISLDNVRVIVNAHLKTAVRNENTFLEIQDLSVKFTTSKMQIKLDNLFNGDKALGNNMNKFLNDNWKDILGELRSTIENALVTIISDVAKPVMNKVPLNQILKD